MNNQQGAVRFSELLWPINAKFNETAGIWSGSRLSSDSEPPSLGKLSLFLAAKMPIIVKIVRKEKSRGILEATMKKRPPIALFFLVTLVVTFSTSGVWSSPGEPVLPVKNESTAGAPVPPGPPAPPGEKRTWNLQKSSAWEKRFFNEPLSQYNFSKSQFRPPSGTGLSLKSPGRLPGIELGVEMHSLGALQTVVPPERLPKSLNAQQDQPLLLSPSNISPDYNGGFLRFTW